MTTRRERQTNFLGGEIAPHWHGRDDIPITRVALELCQNFIVSPGGSLLNRPGTRLVGESKTSGKKCRLIPFSYGGDQNYILEFGDLYFRVHYQGAYLAVEVVTTYAEADLPYLRWTQSGDVLTIVHPNYKPREVKRTAHTGWAIADKSFAAVQSAPTGGGRTLDVSGTNRAWEVWVTAVDSNGNESTALQVVTQPTHGAYTGEGVNVYTWTAPGGTAPAVYNVYRGLNGVAGWVGGSLVASFREDGTDPDYSLRYPDWTNPFASGGNYPSHATYHGQRLWLAGTGNDPRLLRGSVTGIFGLFDARFPPSDYDGLKLSLTGTRWEEIRGVVALGRHLVVVTNETVYLLAGEDPDKALSPVNSPRAIPVAALGASAAVAPLVAMDSLVYVHDSGQQVLALIYDAATGGSFAPRDATVYGHHLLEGHRIVDWCYCRRPYSIVWAVREDGVLLGCTYLPAEGIFAWHQHRFDGGAEDTQENNNTRWTGAVESVATVPESGEDALYLVVKRSVAEYTGGTVYRYVERLASRQVTDFRMGVFVDMAKTVDGRNTGSTTLTVTQYLSGGWAVGATVTVTASASTFVVGDVGRGLSLNPNADRWVLFGGQPVAQASGGGTVVRMTITAYVSATVVRAQLTVAMPAAYSAATKAWAWLNWSITGLASCDYWPVRWISDGVPWAQRLPDQCPTNGSGSGEMTTLRPGAVLTVGVEILYQFVTLDLPAERGKSKQCTRLGAEVRTAKTASWWMGEHISWGLQLPAPGMVEVPQPRHNVSGYQADPQGPFELTVVEGHVPAATSRGKRGRVAVRARDPLPFEVVSVWRDVEVSGGS